MMITAWISVCSAYAVVHDANSEYLTVRQDVSDSGDIRAAPQYSDLGELPFYDQFKPSATIDSFVSCIHRLMSDPRSRKETGEIGFVGCPDVGKIFGALVMGIKDAGFVDTWSCSVDKKDGTATLEVHLNVAEPIYGELASASKVPLSFKVDPRLVVKAATDAQHEWKTNVDVSGLGVVTPEEGLETYAIATEGARCEEAEIQEAMEKVEQWRVTGDVGAIVKDFKKTCIYREQEAAGKYLSTYYKGLKKSKSDADRKVGRFFRKTYGEAKYYYPIKAAGEWPKIFYSVITAGPSDFTSFVFHDGNLMSKEEKRIEKVGVKAGSTRDASWCARSFDLCRKVDVIGTVGLVLAKSNLGMAEKMARSGMAFAEMVSWGAHETILKKIDFPHMADADALMNMFSLCDDGPASRNLPVTAEPSCTGSAIGRVSWAKAVSERFSPAE